MRVMRMVSATSALNSLVGVVISIHIYNTSFDGANVEYRDIHVFTGAFCISENTGRG